MDQSITPFDLQRMFLGDLPFLFYGEIALRTLIIYAYTLLMIRWIGGRGVAQMSMVEFLLVIALGSAVGDSMFYPNVPVFHGMLVVTVVIGLNKLLDLAILRSNRAKNVIDGRPVELVRDGRMLGQGLDISGMGPAEVRMLLRQAGVRNLGVVQHAYLESDGAISVFRQREARPGLPLIPPVSVLPDQPDLPQLRDAGLAPGGLACCVDCGALQDAATAVPDSKCTHCGNRYWIAPQLEDGERAAR